MKKKVLHVSSGGLNRGGVASVVFSIVESLESDFDFDCVVFNRKSDLEEEFEKHGTIHRIHCYPKKGKRDYVELLLRPIKLYFGIRKICKENAYDVIHCHNQHDCVPCLMAAKHLKVPIRISHAHVGSDTRRRSGLEKIGKKMFIKKINKVATHKVACAAEAGRLLFDNADSLHIPNGVNLQRFTKKENEVKQATIFVHVGRFNYAKNQEFLLETFAEISRMIPDAYLYLVGYGETATVAQIKQQIRTLKIEDKVVIIPGDQVDIVDYYAKADYMIFPSRFEGFPVTLIEAQAMGIRCYVSERVTTDADMGLSSFHNLSDGPQKWAEFIVSDIQNGPKLTLNQEKLSQYSNAAVCAKYAAVYRGEA